MMKPSARSPSLTSQESYSAVIIADLVAEVPVEAEQEVSKRMGVKTNLAYDGHMDEENGVQGAELSNLKNVKSNGSGISRGVLLNAVQFGKPEPKSKCDEKPIQLTSPMSVQVLMQPPTAVTQGFKDMSVGRKVAFGFSFIPSIMFVLCFAIILPCNIPKPCVDEKFLTTLNNTEVLSRLQLSPDLKFTALKGKDSYLVTAKEFNNGTVSLVYEKLSNRPTYFNCGNVSNSDKEKNCIVMDVTSKIFIFNSTNDAILWHPVSESGDKPSQPVLLPDCNKDGFDDIAVAVSNTEIQVRFDGNSVSSFPISNCDSVPTNLQSWPRENASDLIFSCEKDGKDTLVRVPQSVWCTSDMNSEENIIELYSSLLNSEKEYNPTEDGVVMWSGEDVSLLQPNGSTLWKVLSSDSHLGKNRHILYGKFTDAKKQVALLSSDLSSHLQITVLDASNGSLVANTSLENYEATEVIPITGSKRDFAIVLLKKLKKGIVSTAMTHISDVSTKIVNFISNEESNNTQLSSRKDITDEIAFLDMSGTHHTITDLIYDDKQGLPYKVSMTVVKDKEELNIYLLRIFSDKSSRKSSTASEIRHIQVSNWDISAKSQQCFPKH